MKLSTQLPDDKAAELAQNHWFESLKHLTTLDAGAILLLVGLLERMFPSPEWKVLTGITLVLFVVSIVCSVMLMWWQGLGGPEDLGKLNKQGFLAYLVLTIGAFWSFLAAIVMFVIFSLKNLY